MEENHGILGQSLAIRQLLQTISQIAPTEISALIIGESGTGKELVAQAIHSQSLRKESQLVVVNCGAIPEGILESELFGHERGAFTGAIGARKGYFELADSGTIFLDEIGEMPLSTQVKLLRVLETQDFMRVGGTRLQKVDVRVIAATNKDLHKAVTSGEFREDLYYRLNAVSIKVPPLRERKEDIPLLVRRIAGNFSRDNHIEFEGFTESALHAMAMYSWPGNVRELKNLIESVIVLEKGRQVDDYVLSKYLKQKTATSDRNLPVPTFRDSEQVEREFIYRALIDLKSEISKLREDLYQAVFPESRPRPLPVYSEVVDDAERTPIQLRPLESDDFSEPNLEGKTLEEVERFMINKALDKHGGSKRKAARDLGISERTLYRKIKEYELPY